MNPNQQPQDINPTNEPVAPGFGTTPTPPVDSPSLSEQPVAAPAFGQPTPDAMPSAPQVSQLEPTPVAAIPEPAAPAPAFGQPAPDAMPSAAFPTPDQPVGGQPPASHAENPGQVLGIISIVLSFVGLAIIGIILGVISRKKSKAANMPTTLGTVGLVVGIVFTIIGTLFTLLIVLTAYAGIQEAARESAESNSSMQAARGSALMEMNAETVADHAEAYFTEAGDYPKTTSDFDKYADSKIPEDIEVYSSLLLTNSSLTYIYCGEGSAQVAYLGDSTDDKRITALGSASSTEVCPKSF